MSVRQEGPGGLLRAGSLHRAQGGHARHEMWEERKIAASGGRNHSLAGSQAERADGKRRSLRTSGGREQIHGHRVQRGC